MKVKEFDSEPFCSSSLEKMEDNRLIFGKKK